jgi:hypothetical protein
MIDWNLIWSLLKGAFVWEKGHLQYPTPKRLFSVLVLLPLFILNLLLNWLFLGLDELLFPAYRKTKIPQAVFIVGIPRSATTFLLHKLARDEQHFTCLKMWEVVLAPSITQKYLVLGLVRVDKLVGRPLYRLSLWLDRVVFGSLRDIHPMGLASPEEDEGLFLHLFSSLYLVYLFPDHPALDPYLRFDREVPEERRQSMMAFYYRCIQRHNYVFNRQGERYFLSKNPTFVPKLTSLAARFPQGKLLFPLRSPQQTIPATISLNAHLYGAFNPFQESPLVERTRDLVLDWYEMAAHALQNSWQDRHLVLPFRQIVQQPGDTFEQIYRWLEVPVSQDTQAYFEQLNQETANYKSPHQYDRQVGVDEELVQQRISDFWPSFMVFLQ